MPHTQTILLISTNPRDTARLQLNKEAREIAEGLRLSPQRDAFRLEKSEAARIKDVRRAMLNHHPRIVHFCGHDEDEAGIVFEDESGHARVVNTEGLAGLFALFADKVECVVLNACYSEIQAKAIARHIPYVVEMNLAISDDTALEFFVAFYDAIGAGKSFEFAYKMACNAIQMMGIPEHLTPVLKRRLSQITLKEKPSGISHGTLAPLLRTDQLYSPEAGETAPAEEEGSCPAPRRKKSEASKRKKSEASKRKKGIIWVFALVVLLGIGSTGYFYQTSPVPEKSAKLEAMRKAAEEKQVKQQGDDWRDSYLTSTVRVSVPGKNEGFGFIVGERAGELYILTANHVVAAMPGENPRIEVYFQQDQGIPAAAKVLARTGKRLDAALLRVNKPKRVTWQSGPYCTPPYDPPKPVQFIGRDRKWFVSRGRDAGQINEREPDYHGHIEISIGSVRPGVSGAPLLSGKGLIGMIIKDQVNGARAVAIDNLRRFVLYQNYPWGLLKCKTTPIPAPSSVVPPADDGNWTEPVTGMEFVWIKGSCFQMGSPDSEKGWSSNEKQHRVCVEGFWMGKHEVSVDNFRHFVEKTGYKTDAEKGGGCYVDKDKDGAWEKEKDASWRKPYFSQEGLHPAVCVSWNDAVAYAEWLSRESGRNYRLPAEAEWEYAARAGTQTARYWGDDPNDACAYANVHDKASKHAFSGFTWTHHQCDDAYAVTAPAGSFQPNKFGLYDILGNVWEWTCSEYEKNYNGEEKGCSSKNHANSLRVLRGGSWDGEPRDVRVAYRYESAPGFRVFLLGFRLARIK
ncbi:MAG: SUMF1/EgtB/PvdO family nonheme iron enzyme [Gammaproteobacteria bacterium]|nr:SUMF1/EgtB/PvdO family nonheme iron enzyme [Gammaproteobacteria bacterium]